LHILPVKNGNLTKIIETCDINYQAKDALSTIADLVNVSNYYAIRLIELHQKIYYKKVILEEYPQVRLMQLTTPPAKTFASIRPLNWLGSQIIDSVKKFAKFGFLKQWKSHDFNLLLLKNQLQDDGDNASKSSKLEMSPSDLSCVANVFIIYGASLVFAIAILTLENLKMYTEVLLNKTFIWK